MPESALGSQQLLQAGKLEQALEAARRELDGDAGNVDALYCMAVAQRYLRRHDEALQTLEQLNEVSPNYARSFQEAGHNYRELGRLHDARRAYQRAVGLNRALHASWRELATIHERQQQHDKAAAAKAEFERLSRLPPELVTVTSLLEEHRLFKAERLCRDFLQRAPHNVEAMRLLALLGMKLFVYDDAEFLLESCVELDPDYWLARLDYVKILHKRQKFEQALEQATILREAFPNNYAFDLAYANQSVAVGNYDTALEVYAHIIDSHPELEQVFLARGHALKTVGRVDEGIASYRDAYRVRTDYGDAYWSLANLKTYRFTDDEIAQMRAQEAQPETAVDDRFHLCFALGKAYEDRQDFEESFAFYARGNRLRKDGLRYDADRAEAAMQRQIDVCNSQLFRDKAEVGSDYADPIFVVGLPRAGSTLLEQILASHSQIDGTLELPNIIATAHRLNGRRGSADEANYPRVLVELQAEHYAKLADSYISDTAIHRKGATHFVDKMPNNFMHVGLIHLMLPRAKVIDARRHPLACCFSGFKQLFADGQEFTYSLEDMARYYRSYVRLMRHWDTVLPGAVLRVHYEHVVADAEREVRRLLEFLELPFEDACLSFYETERSVRTPSSEQVRQPIYKGALEQWRHYEPWLGVLKTELAAEIADYPA